MPVDRPRDVRQELDPQSRGMSMSLHSVGRRIKDVEILSDISMDVRSGDVVAIMGPSGGGKSTLLRCMALLEPFQSGRIDIDSQPAASARALATSGGAVWRAVRNAVLNPATDQLPDFCRQVESLRRQIGFVFQDLELWDHRTVMGNIIEGPTRVLGQSAEQAIVTARQLLSRLDAADLENRKPATLSRGQAQRVAIARALAMSPRLLLMDEPTSSLDVELSAEIMALIRELAASGLTIVLVTHLIDFARRVASQAVVMVGGRIVEQGGTMDVIDNPQTERVKIFLAKASKVR